MNEFRRSVPLFALLLAVGLSLPVSARAGGAERLLELQRQERQTQQLRGARRGQTIRRDTLQDRTLRRRDARQSRPVSRLNRYGRYGTVFLQREGAVQSGSRKNGSRALSTRSRGLSGSRLGEVGALR